MADTMASVTQVQVNESDIKDYYKFVPWDNPDNVITLETYTTMDNIYVCYLNPLMLIIGVPANVLSCVVFFRQGLKDRMNLCLFCLSMVDGMCIFFFTVISSRCLVPFFRPELESWWKWVMTIYFVGIGRGFLLCSGCLTMIISVERCVCVFLPLRATSLIRTRTMAVIVFTTIATLQAICMIYPLKLDVKAMTHPGTNTTSYELVSTQLYLSHTQIFDVLENIVIMNFIPITTFVVVVVATSATVVQLKRIIVWRQRASTSADGTENAASLRQMALARMLVIVSTIFILTASPIVPLGIAPNIEYDFFINRRYNNIFLLSHATFMEMGMINSSGVNFFVYATRSSRFRQELARIVCFRFLKDKKAGLKKDGETVDTVTTGALAQSS